MLKDSYTVIMGVIGSDIHAIGNNIIERYLEEEVEYLEPVNLGVMVESEEFVNAAHETGADAIWISSLYGQGEMDCRDLYEKFVESGLEDVLLYVGGNLTIGKQPYDETVEKYKKMGFDRVYPQNKPDVDLNRIHEVAVEDLLSDIEKLEENGWEKGKIYSSSYL